MRRTDGFSGVMKAAAGAVWLLASGAAVAATPAQGPGAGLSPSAHGPIDIGAESSTYNNTTCESTWNGAVEVLQGDTRLRANAMHVFMSHKTATSADQAGCGNAQRIEADGNVFYVTPDQRARGDHAVYNADENLIVMTGNVILVQGKNVVHGDKLTIHTVTRAAEMQSSSRVRAVFYQDETGTPGGAPAAPH
jgi:lipopolysaccharide export system protein LptA